MRNQKGFAHLLLIIVVVGVVAALVLTFITIKSHQNDSELAKNANPDSGKQTSASYAVCDSPEKLARVNSRFTNKPFDTANIRFITAGESTASGDPRFTYQWIESGKSVTIYAPADGKLVTIRHKVAPQSDGTTYRDFDIFFEVDTDCQAIYRFNHITNLRSDIEATYRGGEDQPTGDYLNGGQDDPKLIVPLKEIHVSAGEKLGTTTGTPVAHNFDYALSILKKKPDTDYSGTAICPLDVFPSSISTSLINLLAPDQYSGPTPGTPCSVHEIGQ